MIHDPSRIAPGPNVTTSRVDLPVTERTMQAFHEIASADRVSGLSWALRRFDALPFGLREAILYGVRSGKIE